MIVVDLFSGSGSLGLEAYSRGAQPVFLVEKNKYLCDAISENAGKVDSALKGKQQYKIIHCDAFKVYSVLKELHGTIDLIFADPPYEPVSEGAGKLLSCPIIAAWAAGAVLILEHSSKEQLPESHGNWLEFKRKDYGLTSVSFWENVYKPC